MEDEVQKFLEKGTHRGRMTDWCALTSTEDAAERIVMRKLLGGVL